MIELKNVQPFVSLKSGNAAHIFGLKSKGKIDIGADADILLFDPNKTATLRNEDMKTKCGWTPFAGMTVSGVPKYVITQGEVIKL